MERENSRQHQSWRVSHSIGAPGVRCWQFVLFLPVHELMKITSGFMRMCAGYTILVNPSSTRLARR